MYSLAGRHAVEEGQRDAVQREHAAHVPGLGPCADRRERGIGIAGAGHVATEGQVGGIVHPIVAPGTVLTEVGQRV
jgi:hypothetical protein